MDKIVLLITANCAQFHLISLNAKLIIILRIALLLMVKNAIK